MRGLCISLLLIASCMAADDPKQLLSSIKQKVVEQISKTANYTCVETLDRAYYRDTGFELAIHGPAAIIKPTNELLHDRLRLDVGVSEYKEIYSWHGSPTLFSSSEVADVVRTGPISSGQFIGYLRNIFLSPGIAFTYEPSGDTDLYRFNYDVPPLVTRYQVYATGGGFVIAPFRGSFTVHKSNLQLASLEVSPYNVPFNSSIQSASTEVKYQLTRLSGRDALIPASFVLQLEDESHIFTVSSGEFSGCHEYGAESTLRFDLPDTPEAAPAAAPIASPEPVLPPGLELHIALSSGIDDETSYTGDSVTGVLLDQVRAGPDIIPRGAVVSGVLTQLETHFRPQRYCKVKIEFRRITFGKRAYRMRALHQATSKDMHVLSALYGATIEASFDELRDGTILIDSSHVRLRPGFKADWRIQPIPAPDVRSRVVR
jgi:hypothetical protein